MRVNREFILNQSSVFIFGIRKCLELIDDISQRSEQKIF